MDQVFAINAVFPRLSRPTYVVNPHHIVESAYSRLITPRTTRLGYNNLSELLTTIARLARAGTQSKLIYSYWPELDAVCHSHGVDSEIAQRHLQELNTGFAWLVEELQGSDTVVIACADHGLIGTSSQRTVWLHEHPQVEETLLLPLCGEPRVAYCYVKAHKSAAFEAYVQQHLAQFCTLHRSTDLIEQNLFGLGTPNPKLLERVGDYTLLMQENYIIKDRLPGEKPFVFAGVHGGLSSWEMYVPLIVAGI